MLTNKRKRILVGILLIVGLFLIVELFLYFKIKKKGGVYEDNKYVSVESKTNGWEELEKCFFSDNEVVPGFSIQAQFVTYFEQEDLIKVNCGDELIDLYITDNSFFSVVESYKREYVEGRLKTGKVPVSKTDFFSTLEVNDYVNINIYKNEEKFYIRDILIDKVRKYEN